MDKLTAIKIKYDDGTYSDEIPVSVLAENVEWDSTHTLVDILGSIDVDVTGTIQDQISQLFNKKVDSTDLSNYVNSTLKSEVTSWLNQNVDPVGSAVIVDSSLTVSGAAADAKVVGDEFTNLKTDFVKYNSVDMLNGELTRTSGTHNGITYTWNKDVCDVNGTATSISVNIVRVNSALPDKMLPGKSYYIQYSTTDKKVRLRIIFRNANNADVATLYCESNTKFTVPVNATKCTIALYVNSGAIINHALVSSIVILNTISNQALEEESFLYREILPDGTDLNDVTQSGIYLLASTRIYPNIPHDFDDLCILEVFGSEMYIEQRITNIVTQIFYKRFLSKDVWLPWVDGYIPSLAYNSHSVLSNGTNLNDVLDPGYYLITNSYTYSNVPYDTPSAFPGTLEVLHTTNNTILQRVTYHGNGKQEIYTRQTTLGEFVEDWKTYPDEPKETYVFADLDESKYIVARVAMYPSQTDLNGYSSKLIPIKKGDNVHIRTTTQYPILPFAIVKFNYLITYKEPYVDESTVHSYEKDFVAEHDGFIAVNCIATYYKDFELIISHEKITEFVNNKLYINALQNPYNFIPEYDKNNLTKVLKKGPSLMGAIHHWGLIGASYDSGELNYTKSGATEEQRSSLDYYEYSWMSELQRSNGIKDLYHYSNGGQNAKQWITLTGNVAIDGTARGYCYTTGEYEIAQTWNGGLSEVAGIGPGGGCWWKLKEDFANGKAKQAYVIVLGSNDINNNNPHDSSWNELAEGSYDTTLYYKAGSIEDIGTYDLSTDTDTPPTGKTAGVVPGIVNSYAAYIGAILNRIIAQQPDCVIFLSTIRNNFAWNENSLAIWNEYNNILRQIVQMDRFKNNVFLIDFAEYGPNYMQKDLHDCLVGMHPNAIGYHEVAYYYGTLIDYVIRNNFKRLAQSAFIGTNFVYRYDS